MSGMGIRVWGVVADRLIEVCAEPGYEGGLVIEGLPADVARSSRDRVRAALVNSRVADDMPAVTVRLRPALRGPPRGELDVAIAIAVLGHLGALDERLAWILATARLGLDGRVRSKDVDELPSIVTVVTSLNVTGV